MGTRLSLVQGDTALLRFQIMNADETPVDLTLFDILFTIKRSNQDTDAEALWQGTLTDGVAKVAPEADGFCDVTIPADVVKLLRVGRPVYWDIQTSVDDQIFTPLFGDMLVDAEVTRAGS